MARRQAAALVVAVLALVTGWVAGEPGFGGPDEISHYQRAVSIPLSGLEGEPAPDFTGLRYTPQQLAVVRQEARTVRVGPGLSPTGRTCHLEPGGPSAACLDDLPPIELAPSDQLTPVGSYPPLTYVLPGAAGGRSTDPLVAVAVASGVSAALCVVLVLGGVVLLHRPGTGALWIAGPVVALTPMALYLLAALNPSGAEVAAGVGLGCALLRLARPGRPPAGAWAVGAVSAVVLALARSVSPLWLVAHVAFALLLAGPTRLRALRDADRRPLVAAAAAVGGALLVAAGWWAANGTSPRMSLLPLGAALADGVREARIAVGTQAIFAPGYLDTPVPGWILALWRVMAVVLLGAALAVGTARQRLALAVVALGALALPVVLQAALLRNTGFPVQGRHVLPVLVAVPLLAGEVLSERVERLRTSVRTWLPVALAAAAACAHVGAWWVVARRAAVSIRGPWLFLGRAEWDPPLGWGIWGLLVVAGAAALVAATLPRWPGVNGRAGARSAPSGRR